MVLGGLSAMLYGGHPSLSVGMFLRKVDMRTVFFATIFVIVVLVLAYLTNPSETSFRAYLTEQSFRQHLTRLDDTSQDDLADPKRTGLLYTVSRRLPSVAPKPGRDYDTHSPFHFVNRASISLRTPKHVFHSLGICTIAAVYPNGPPPSRGMRIEGLPSTVNDSWFIGAFGRWWRGGTLHAWCHDAITNAKDAERLNSGILDVKALDSLESYDGLPFTTSSTSTSLHLPNTDSTSKLRGTERSTQRTVSNSTRSTTPPPLPKSASLPLHAPRHSTTPSRRDRSCSSRQNHNPAQPSTCVATDSLRLSPSPSLTYSPSSTSLFDQSPVIAEILRQITHSKTAVLDVHTQLSDVRAAAAASHATIQGDLDAQRERKRTEDAARAELKSRTKTLDDEKRAAEGGRRDAEKRLRAAEGARDSASRRVERLDKEIGALRERMREDEMAAARAKDDGGCAKREIAEEVAAKRKEIKVAEDVIVALTARAKELEEKIGQEEERLRGAREQAELRKQDRSFFPLHVAPAVEEAAQAPWSPITGFSSLQEQDTHAQINTDFSAGIEIFSQSTQVSPRLLQASNRAPDALVSQQHLAVSPRPKTLSLSGISNFRDRFRSSTGGQANGDVLLPTNGFSLLDDKASSSLSSGPSHATRFSPFADNDHDLLFGGDAISPRSTSLIPSSLISSLERGASMDDIAELGSGSSALHTEEDDVLEPNWRARTDYVHSSPTSITNPSFDGIDQEDPFEIRPPPLVARRRLTGDSLEAPRPLMPTAGRTISDPQHVPQVNEQEAENKASAAHRRWHSVGPKEKDREKKGLNPEAEVFRLNKTSLPTLSHPPSLGLFKSKPKNAVSAVFDLPGNAPSLASQPDSLFSSFSMHRAFAPSPAEREALQRALGSSSNTSLERLPTLSEVSLASMPSSPSHVHAIAAQRTSPGAGSSRTLLPPGLSWLQSLPRMRKPAFSPWEDEVGEAKGGKRSQ
ncbi:uncharacterized protein LAESUDRAFT_672224 [Laetiporus sulphureus 93-53]|uniref:Proteophosphoglycan ppg4 n=1 Tax=Laetiporus sulphureus 93-53 TaxID=1314785 RepID=A0A165GSK9_9APHY|nr:uncharacterized protein LAESUDRAFT_672224 [Laetiporus sulphureus 93-53]KZT10752.1 hypothetical protein LAESUDRAFT_672224 [Laetiporus sulphureus 93-53]